MRLGWNVRTALLTLLCVVGLFLFPATAGSFSSTHGPVTALQSVDRARRLKVSIAATPALTTPVASQLYFEADASAVTSVVIFEVAAPQRALSSSLRI
jgi:hypothetical protein